MKNISKILSLSLLIGLAFMSSCKDDDPETKPVVEKGTVVHSGSISEDETWTTDNYHELAGKVVVEAGATLTINPGVIIKARTGAGSLSSALIVARGGKINAAGDANNPIIMTSVLDNIEYGQKTGSNLNESDREKWGGLIVLGKAPISAEDGDVEAQIEGIPADEAFGRYGGSDPEDNSGTITYVSVRHGGALIGEGNEINGITFGGVGNKTIVHHIEVIGNLDDGVECFGGTVNISHVVVAYQGDDAIDLDMNYSGTIDNFVVVHGGDTDEGLEIDGPEGSTHTTGLFTLKNGTLTSVDGNGSAGDFKSKAQGTVENVAFIGYNTYVKVRANYDDGNNCAVKSDAWKYLTDASAKLTFKNCEFVGASSLAAAVNAYTGVEACDTAVTTAVQDAVDAAISGNGNTNPGTATTGADMSEFSGWSWADLNGKLN